MKNLLLLFFIIWPLSSFAIVNEVDFDFGYNRQIYGVNRQNSNVTRTYAGSLATYIFNYTAIDITASKSEDITTENDRYTIATGYDLVGQQNKVTSYVYGLGIKQMFAPRNSRIIPGISLGYAKQFVNYNSEFTIQDTGAGSRTVIRSGTTKQRIDSVFGTFSIQFRMTERLSIKASIKTLFKAVEFNQARDNLNYAAGFSWIF